MADTDTYAVVQKRRAPPGPEAGARGRGAEEAPLYSQVLPRARRPQGRAEEAQGAPPGRGESGPPGCGLGGPAPACSCARRRVAGVEGPAASRTPAPKAGLVTAKADVGASPAAPLGLLPAPARPEVPQA